MLTLCACSISALIGADSKGYADFSAGYKSLAARDYDAAIESFRLGLEKDPAAASIHKDLGYTLLKTGQDGAARDEFGAALKLNQSDQQAALEFAFLAYETGEPAEARLMFEQLKMSGSPAIRQVAEQAYRNSEAAPAAVVRPLDFGAAGQALKSPSRSNNLWAFFDSSYRGRADVEYLARRWRESGISALHVASWHNLEPDPATDAYLTALIQACHRQAILVYAWLELPYAGEKFWMEHPEWREKNASGQDAQLGWRKPMNLQNPECSRALAAKVEALLSGFDWDGVNLAELSFGEPENLLPMNDNVRAEFTEVAGWDPKLLSAAGSPHANQKDLKTFLGFRRVLASRMQAEWQLNVKNSLKSKPYLDLVVTRASGSALIMEDFSGKQIGIDVSVCNRGGADLLQAVREAGRSSLRIALYAENFVQPSDWPLLSAAASSAQVTVKSAGEMQVDAQQETRIPWAGPAVVDGRPWPLRGADSILIPAGHHTITAAGQPLPLTITDFNADVQSVEVSSTRVDVSYVSRTRALATLDGNVSGIEIDGVPLAKTKPETWAQLPAGQHLVTFTR